MGEWTRVGSLHTRSEFTKSLWGDERLFFQHGWLSLDRDHHTVDGTKTWRFRNNIPAFDKEKWLEWDETYDVPQSTGQDVADGILNHGCPFYWVIQYINQHDAETI